MARFYRGNDHRSNGHKLPLGHATRDEIKSKQVFYILLNTTKKSWVITTYSIQLCTILYLYQKYFSTTHCVSVFKVRNVKRIKHNFTKQLIVQKGYAKT